MTFVLGLTVIVMFLSSLFRHCLPGEGTGINKGKGSINRFDVSRDSIFQTSYHLLPSLLRRRSRPLCKVHSLV